MCRIKTAVITTSRADYGLLFPLIRSMRDDETFDLYLIVTGSHLSGAHGRTVRQITSDGFNNFEIIDMTNDSDTESAVCDSIALGINRFSDIFSSKKFDLMIVLGDRYELWPACIAAVIHKVPIAHIHGGETTFGAIDECIRHSVTKMAFLHFPSIEAYGRRIIQMGEDPERVYVVGALGIDNIREISLMSMEELNSLTGVDFNEKVALMTYHPVTLDEYEMGAGQIEEILNALLSIENIKVLITAPNADVGYSSILKTILSYTELYPAKFKFVTSLGQRAYLSALKYACMMIGNSSSGIIESASFKLPVVNVGDRQAGRFKPANVIDCECMAESVKAAVSKAISAEFAQSISNLENPYGDGKTADRIIKILKQIDFRDKSALLKKKFYDIRGEFTGSY
jgi:UDP-hydrolysing UDP-N-acetyl-D-glucosamine 2-epimerase